MYQLSPYVFNYLALIAEDPEGSSLLTQELAKGPPWRPSFFEALPGYLKTTVLRLS